MFHDFPHCHICGSTTNVHEKHCTDWAQNHDELSEIPTDAEVFDGLTLEQREVAESILKMLTDHLGSYDAARLWVMLCDPVSIGRKPIELIREGYGHIIISLLESQWGPSPTYG